MTDRTVGSSPTSSPPPSVRAIVNWLETSAVAKADSSGRKNWDNVNGIDCIRVKTSNGNGKRIVALSTAPMAATDAVAPLASTRRKHRSHHEKSDSLQQLDDVMRDLADFVKIGLEDSGSCQEQKAPGVPAQMILRRPRQEVDSFWLFVREYLNITDEELYG